MTVRLIIWGLLSLPAVREAYDFFHVPNKHRLGQNFWTAICIVVTECLIDYKMGEVGKPRGIERRTSSMGRISRRSRRP